MQRISTPPRDRWRERLEGAGFGYHSGPDGPYWNETAYYAFEPSEIESIERATAELWECCLEMVQLVIDRGLYHRFHIPEAFIPYIEKTWEEDHPSIYGRFDLAYRGGQIKLLEFNADTPTSLFEAGIVQWYWLQDVAPWSDQFNSIHEKLVGYLRSASSCFRPGLLHFACVRHSLEDLTNTEYLRDCAQQAGLDTRLLHVDDIGWDLERELFVDPNEEPIRNLFKLYPWEWLSREPFHVYLLRNTNEMYWIEPAWKMILSNKAILALLWERFPGHPNLLPACLNGPPSPDYVRKPLLSREGANVDVFQGGSLRVTTPGIYGAEGYVYQQYFELADLSGQHPILGSWVIGQEPAGIGIRETEGLVTNDRSRFVPHLIRT